MKLLRLATPALVLLLALAGGAVHADQPSAAAAASVGEPVAATGAASGAGVSWA